ncbi:hypothetical protein Tco_1331026, partial [Tanacetum coccineum]
MTNRDKADVCGVGTVQMKFTSGKTVTLHNVLHVPTISKSLVSVGKLDKHGFKIAIESRKVVITKWGLFVGKGYYQEGMYRLNVEKVKRDTGLLELIHSDICQLNGILTRGGN